MQRAQFDEELDLGPSLHDAGTGAELPSSSSPLESLLNIDDALNDARFDEIAVDDLHNDDSIFRFLNDYTQEEEQTVIRQVKIDEYRLVLDMGEKRLEHRFVEKASAQGGRVKLERIDYSGASKQQAIEERRMVYAYENSYWQLCEVEVVIEPSVPGQRPGTKDIHESFNKIARAVKTEVQQCGKEKRAHDMSRSDYSNDVSNMTLQGGLMTKVTKGKGDNLVNDFKASLFLDRHDGQYKVLLVHCKEAVEKYDAIKEKAKARSRKRRGTTGSEQEEGLGSAKRARAEP
ncbi:hypothetical protein GUITHDRAFT_104399 [Guillardia theta CCMP2712]|uniref:Uncharacterized protein n=1 Tax=Guillardia theta (strain CCMP2712) TaxID=905079 RepID=L1JN37_GUITC|nr:hypothetical protein GUITHDRAFT_104399 [Guillardia theta CCMP2712]EKX50001.1 hypothetical protein GUITHDRAFT_104399 [Guillardia theta CCMP2712]|eukprot:XP_005836981.1 hypothetical protein GUITHDRAFT_104399 [Guillardia theta CCMP2712]